MNHIQELNNIIKNNNHTQFFLFIKTLDIKQTENTINYLINNNIHPEWLEHLINRLHVNISKEFFFSKTKILIQHNIINLNILRKIIALNIIYQYDNFDHINKLIDNTYNYFYHIYHNKNNIKIFTSDILFYKIISFIKKIKTFNLQINKYIIELLVYKYSEERQLDKQIVLQSIYKYLNFSPYY